jgi:hypothetical protein
VQESFTKSYWQGLFPQLHIEDSATLALNTPLPVDADEMAAAEDAFKREAYFELLPPHWGQNLPALAEVIDQLHEKGWPPVFCFVYDEFWLLITRMVPMLEPFIGTPVMRLPDIWAWRLSPTEETPGWKPHRDKGKKTLRPDGTPKSMTYWLPLRDATAMNGCMFILPAHLDPHYGTEDERRPNVPLPDIRALPAAAGTPMFWNQAVLHWSGRCSRRAPQGRISLSCEYQRADEPPQNEPLEDATTIPPFEKRLKLIARQMVQYRHMEPLEGFGPMVQRFLNG